MCELILKFVEDKGQDKEKLKTQTLTLKLHPSQVEKEKKQQQQKSMPCSRKLLIFELTFAS